MSPPGFVPAGRGIRRGRSRGAPSLQSKVQAFGEIAECLRRVTQHGVFFTKASDLGAALAGTRADSLGDGISR
jgi:hypothetical protein